MVVGKRRAADSELLVGMGLMAAKTTPHSGDTPAPGEAVDEQKEADGR
jgi:hypothetical protein